MGQLNLNSRIICKVFSYFSIESIWFFNFPNIKIKIIISWICAVFHNCTYILLPIVCISFYHVFIILTTHLHCSFIVFICWFSLNPCFFLFSLYCIICLKCAIQMKIDWLIDWLIDWTIINLWINPWLHSETLLNEWTSAWFMGSPRFGWPYLRQPEVFLKTVVHSASRGFESSFGSCSHPEWGMMTSLVKVCRPWLMITIFRGS